MIHVVYLSVIGLLFAGIAIQRARAAFWKRMHDNASKHWWETLELAKRLHAALLAMQPYVDAMKAREWPGTIERKEI